VDDEEPVREVDHPERDPGRHERQPEALHLPEERPAELEPELEPPVAEEHEVDGERAGEVPDDHADGALVPDRDEQDRRDDGDDHVCECRRDIAGRPLLDSEERGQLLVVHLRPQQDQRRAHGVRVGARREEQVRDLGRDQPADDQPERRHRHREPEGGADDRGPAGVVLGVEVEAEEGHGDAHAQHDHQHDRQRHERVDDADVARAQVTGDDRQQKDADQPRDDGAQAVDGGMLGQTAQLLCDHVEKFR